MSDEDSEPTPTGERTLLVPPVWFLVFAGAEIFLGRIHFGPGVFVPFVASIALGLAATGLVCGLLALRLFQKAATTHHPTDPGAATALVTSGIYQFTRNPMYLGLALILFAIALWYGTLTVLVLPFLFMLVLTLVQIIPEERALERRFGAAYRAYKAKTPRWFLI
ncbi:MAG: isoprenylcysteine carboxylmethyltransferase family protein [Pseudomonadota bacterium]